MPITPTYPGVYVQELPSSVHNIAGVSTSVTAFVDWFARGPLNQPTLVSSFNEFQAQFGGLNAASESSYGLLQYFGNGGSAAWVVRIAGGALVAPIVNLADAAAANTLSTAAASPGVWGNNLQVGIDTNGLPAGTFNLVAREVDSIKSPTRVVRSEIFRNLTMTPGDRNYAPSVVNAQSSLVTLGDLGAAGQTPPAATSTSSLTPAAIADVSTAGLKNFVSLNTSATTASDGGAPDQTAYTNGLATLTRMDPFRFNLLCLPGAVNLTATALSAVYAAAAQLCVTERAFLLVDTPPSVTGITGGAGIVTWTGALALGSNGTNAAVYFPPLQVADPLNQSRLRVVGPSGTMAGVYARTDANRGVWKAPAGIDATLNGASVAMVLNDDDSGVMNPQGINALRNFATVGNVSWGARTLQGADQLGSQWAYIPVRRTAMYIEESLYEGLKWVVFEPNDEPLWAQIRLNVGAFLHGMFRQGAFQGKSPSVAYFVKCDTETTTQTDINSGIVNIVVGFAPLKPAEFVVLQIEQMAGAIAT